MIIMYSDSLQGEVCGWTFFFVGVAAVALGSSYYHLKPNDARLIWDRLPVSFFFIYFISNESLQIREYNSRGHI